MAVQKVTVCTHGETATFIVGRLLMEWKMGRELGGKVKKMLQIFMKENLRLIWSMVRVSLLGRLVANTLANIKTIWNMVMDKWSGQMEAYTEVFGWKEFKKVSVLWNLQMESLKLVSSNKMFFVNFYLKLVRSLSSKIFMANFHLILNKNYFCT